MNDIEDALIKEIYSNSLAKPDETLYEHTKLLLYNFEVLKNLGYLNSNVNDIEEILYLSCLYHDMGKINPVFQQRLKNKNKFDKIKLKVSDSYLKGGNIIDLLEEKYTIVKTVREYKKQINPNDMIITVENVYEEHIKEVLKLV